MTARVGLRVATRSAAALALRTRSTDTTVGGSRIASPIRYAVSSSAGVGPVGVVRLGGVVVRDLPVGQERREEERVVAPRLEVRRHPTALRPRAGRSAAPVRDAAAARANDCSLESSAARSTSHSGSRRSATTVSGGRSGEQHAALLEHLAHGGARPARGPARPRSPSARPTPRATGRPTAGRGASSRASTPPPGKTHVRGANAMVATRRSMNTSTPDVVRPQGPTRHARASPSPHTEA